MAETEKDEKPEEQTQWDGAQYEVALAHLEHLQAQIDGLRAALPSMAAPFAQPGLDKAKVFKSVKSAALQSTADLQSFREAWTSEQTQHLFAKSRESFKKDDDLSKASNLPRYGWGEAQ